MATLAHSHFVEWDCETTRYGMTTALCGTRVHKVTDHADEPTCPACKAILTKIEKLYGEPNEAAQ